MSQIIDYSQFTVPVRPSNRYLGIAAPFNFQSKGYFEPKGTADVLWSSILNILLTPVGTRIMIPDFGGGIDTLLFEPNDDQLEALGRAYIFEALAKWEPRIRMIDTEVLRGPSSDVIQFRLTYEIVKESQIESRTFQITPQVNLGATN